MLTGKQRSFLKAKANTLKPLMQIGKEGISESVILQIDNMLNDHELLKINVLQTCGENSKDIAFKICEELKSEFVSALGNKAVIYRESRTMDREDRIVLPR